MKHFDIIIIGGGASGLMTALSLEKSKKSVAILEAGYTLGKKILVTGNGRCNLTNLNMSSTFFNQNIDQYLKRFNEKDTLNFFRSIGLETYADSEGRVYPASNSAKSVVDVILKRISKLKNVTVFTDSLVKQIDFNKREVYCNDNTFSYDNLVISCGNISNEYLLEFDKLLAKKSPSLVALKVKENTKNLDGIRVANVKVTATHKAKKKEDSGEVLFKEGGLSGICVFNLSTLFARAKDFSGIISIDLLPKVSQSDTVKLIEKRCKLFESVGEIFTGLFVDTIREEIFKRGKINEKLKSSNLTKTKINEIVNLIHSLDYFVCGAYSNNQVISGGIMLDNLTEDLSVIGCPNVYFTGEAIDVDGECGGYNLQWAWTSGHIVGTKLK